MHDYASWVPAFICLFANPAAEQILLNLAFRDTSATNLEDTLLREGSTDDVPGLNDAMQHAVSIEARKSDQSCLHTSELAGHWEALKSGKQSSEFGLPNASLVHCTLFCSQAKPPGLFWPIYKGHLQTHCTCSLVKRCYWTAWNPYTTMYHTCIMQSYQSAPHASLYSHS